MSEVLARSGRRLDRMLALAVVDPVVGFTRAEGSYGRTHGHQALDLIAGSLKRIAAFSNALDHASPQAWVRSVYSPRQFASTGPMMNVCVEDSLDCDFDASLQPPTHAMVATKHDLDATGEPQFLRWIGGFHETGVEMVVVAGFLLTACGRDTAIGIAGRLERDGVEVAVARNLTATGLHNYENLHGRPSAVENSLLQLQQAGVHTPPTISALSRCDHKPVAEF